MINNFILLSKPSQGNKELSVNPHKIKEIHQIINANDVSELNF